MNEEPYNPPTTVDEVKAKAMEFLKKTYRPNWAKHPQHAYTYYCLEYGETDNLIMTRKGYSELVIELAKEKRDIK